jgi:hypothetical protein
LTLTFEIEEKPELSPIISVLALIQDRIDLILQQYHLVNLLDQEETIKQESIQK